MNMPNHIAIILDGNGRWAKAKECRGVMAMWWAAIIWKRCAILSAIWE